MDDYRTAATDHADRQHQPEPGSTDTMTRPFENEPECTCDGRQEFVCHDIRDEPHLVGCPRWGTPKRDDRTVYESHEWNPTADDMECVFCGGAWIDCDDYCLRQMGQIERDIRRARRIQRETPPTWGMP